MALPSSGELSFNEINIELGNSSGTEASMNAMTSDALVGTNSTISNTPDAVSDWYDFDAIPQAPTSASITSYDHILEVVQCAWTNNAYNQTQFRVEKNVNLGGYVFVGNTTSTNYSFSQTCANGQTMTIRVRAENSAGESGWSESGGYGIDCDGSGGAV